MTPRTRIKICGITSIADADLCLEAGVDAIGVNLIPSSLRVVSIASAFEISRHIGTRALVVGVVANLSLDEMIEARDRAELGCLQLHGDEPPDVVYALLPHAYKVIRVRDHADVNEADRYPGDYLLVDAKVDGVLGGTGVRIDPALVIDLARRRRLTLAGGLTPSNVASAVEIVRPYCVDVASGVEVPGVPRTKDFTLVHAFVAAVRTADRAD